MHAHVYCVCIHTLYIIYIYVKFHKLHPFQKLESNCPKSVPQLLIDTKELGEEA